jgi:hypothetical protein
VGDTCSDAADGSHVKLLHGCSQIVRDRALSPQEIQAVGSFLSDSVAEFAGLASSDVALKVRRVECEPTPQCKLWGGHVLKPAVASLQGLIRHSEVLERDVAVNGEASEALQRMLSRSMSLGEVRKCGGAFGVVRGFSMSPYGSKKPDCCCHHTAHMCLATP